ncbi:MAG TPA: ATPase domain-containing protein [Gemmatimonadaceae bacterium]|nr:ATPase domain-containing protein [Gemmatimonadaceae bacterium]
MMDNIEKHTNGGREPGLPPEAILHDLEHLDLRTHDLRTDGGATPRTLSTGIPGLDDILGGGLPAERLYVVEGQPGSGKTTLSLQFLLDGRDRGERGLYVTLSETNQEVQGVAQSHGWSLAGIDFLDMVASPALTSPESQYTVFHPSEVELQDTVSSVLARVEQVQPTRVVLDSLSEMRLLARDPLRFRRQILALKQFFAARGSTVLLLDDQTTEGIEMPLHSLAHGVIRLEQLVLAHGAERRQLRVPKLRGVRFHSGYHDFVIRTGGLEVFPRIRLGLQPFDGGRDVTSSGSAPLDNLLGGGLVRGASVLLMGAPGTGKSVLASQYAAAAGSRGERVCIYLFDERLHTFLERAEGLGMDIRRHVESGHISVTSLEPTELSPGEFSSRLTSAADAGVRLVVIDSLNGFTQAMAQERQITSKIHELLGHLGSRGVTTLITLAQRGIFGSPPDEAADISYLADAVILLRYFEAQGQVRRAISAVKQRSAAHEATIREFRIGRGGLQLGEPLREFQGVLLGVPMYTGGRAGLLRDYAGS